MKYRNGAYEALAKRFERKPDEHCFGTHYASLGIFQDKEKFSTFENPYLAIAEAQDILQRIAPMLSGEALRQLQDSRPKEVDANVKGTLHRNVFGPVAGLARECFNRIEHARNALKHYEFKPTVSSRIAEACSQTFTIENSRGHYPRSWGISFDISARSNSELIETSAARWDKCYKVFAPTRHVLLLENDLWSANKKLILEASPEISERDNIYVRECEYVELPEVEKQSGYLAYCQTNEHLFKTITKTPHGARRSCETMIRNAVVANFS